MSIFAISDLHLSFANKKPMDIFGENWIGYEEKIKTDWINVVKENDLVLLPGDFSWAMYLENTYKDFEFLNNLPGKKLLLKGNHDYWWSTLTKLRKYLEENNFRSIDFIHNNSYLYDDKIIVGTRGWTQMEENAEKMIKRENLRLNLSLQDGIKKYGTDKEIIVCMHYPPFNNFEEPELNFINTMKKYNVKQCVYGHIHGKKSSEEVFQGKIEEIEFKLVSCDILDFKLVKL